MELLNENLLPEISNIIYEYCKMYTLVDWVDPKSLNWYDLSANPDAIEILKANPDKVDWYGLSLNPNPVAVEMLKANPDKVDWHALSANSAAIEMLKANLDKVNWGFLSCNPSIFHLTSSF